MQHKTYSISENTPFSKDFEGASTNVVTGVFFEREIHAFYPLE